MDFGYCCSSSCGPMGNNLGMPANPKFVIVSDVILAQHMCEGYHFIDFTNVTQIKVLPGDMLGWYSSSRTGKIAVVEEGSHEQCLVYEKVGDGGMAGQIFNESLQKSVSNMIFALSANFVPQSFSKASFNLERVARHKAVVELRDNFGNRAEMSNENIVCQRAVAGLSIEVPEVALVGEVVLGLNVTNGTNVTFIIHSGDGKVIHQSENSVKLNYTSTGVRDITVMAFNDVSAAIGECKGPVMLHGIKNVSILPVNPVATNDTFTLTIIISQGSSVDLNVSLGDESPGFNVSKFDVNDTFVVTKNHSYRRDGVYCVKALSKNSLTNASAEINITVQTSIAGLQVIAPQTVHSSKDDLVINISITQGTDVQYNVTLQDETKTANGLSVTVVFPKERLRPGLALLQVKAYNLLSSSQKLIYITIETPISGAWLKLASPTRAVEAGKSVKYEFYYDTGSSVNITFWKSIDEEGVPIILKQEKLVLSFEDVKYSNPGVFIARVNYSNALGWFVDERTVIVQHPVKDIDIITNSPTPLPPGIVNITVKQSGTIATNATLICSYGDGTTSESLDFTGELDISHRCLCRT